MPKLLPLAATLLAATALAPAALGQPVTGPYVSLGAGYNFLQDQYLHTDPAISGIPAGAFNTTTGTGSGSNATRYRWGDGLDAQGSFGYGFGNGLRVELEGAYFMNNLQSRPGSPVPGSTTGRRDSYGPMANVLYDLDLGALGIPSFGLTPYVGIGGGYLWTRNAGLTTLNGDGTVDRVAGTSGSIAYQAIAGIAYPLTMVTPGLDLTVEYRYLGTVSPDSAFSGTHYQPFGVNKGNVNLSNQANHSIMLGLRYALFQPPPPAPPAPPAPPPPAPVQEARTYLVFFDWDRADLTERARQIVAEAAQASQHVQTTRIEVNGHTDLSGTAAYNLKLSVRRAKSVQAELIRDGVQPGEIEIHGYGESNPLVPTAKGVREPQNRRVEIILR